MDRERLSHLAHERHPVACPFSDETVDALVERLVLPRTASVLDLGSGRGEWVVRVLARHEHAKAVAVDRSEPALEAAAARARELGIKDRLTLFHGEVTEYLANSANDHDLVLCAGSDHAFGSLDDAWKTLAGRLRPAGTLLMAHGFWEGRPGEAARQALGGSRGESLPVGAAALVEPPLALGLVPVQVTISTPREWDDYEWSWIGSLEDHALAHPDEEPEALRAAAAEHREAYLGGYRGVLGFAAVIARRPG